MEVIFIKDLKNQGKKGEIKEVKDGYAKNFLIKNGYAVMKNETSLKELKRNLNNEKKLDEENRIKANKLKESLEKETYFIFLPLYFESSITNFLAISKWLNKKERMNNFNHFALWKIFLKFNSEILYFCLSPTNT